MGAPCAIAPRAESRIGLHGGAVRAGMARLRAVGQNLAGGEEKMSRQEEPWAEPLLGEIRAGLRKEFQTEISVLRAEISALRSKMEAMEAKRFDALVARVDSRSQASAMASCTGSWS